MIISLYFHQIW